MVAVTVKAQRSLQSFMTILLKELLFALVQLSCNNKYFLNLEKSNKKKSSVHKIFTRDSKLTNDSEKIMDELESFYANLFDGSSCPLVSTTPMFLVDISNGISYINR